MADYDLGTARGRVEIDASGAAAGLTTATGAARGLGTESAAAAGGGVALLSKGLFAMGAAAAAGFGLAVFSAAEFEKTLSNFKSVSGATEEQMEAISDKALQLGRDTAFGAGQAGDAMVELAKQGLTVEEVLNGAADATVALAAAGEVDLTTAATIAANAMNQFKLEAEDLTRVADILSGAANASATDVEGIGLALSYVGPVANAAGLSIEDTAAAVAVLANNGIDANKAGTTLRAILTQLQPTTERAATAMEELNLITEDGTSVFFDSEGQIKSMAEIVDLLNGAFGGLTEQQKLAYGEAIFGREPLAAISALASTSEEEFAALYETIGNTSAAEVAEEKLDNLSGDITILKGSIETFLIGAGRPMQEGLRKIAQFATEVVNAMANLSPEVQRFIGYGVAAVAVIGLVGSGLLLASKATAAFKAAFLALGTVMKAHPLVLLATVVALAAYGLYQLYQRNEEFRESVNAIGRELKPVLDALLEGLSKLWAFLKEQLAPVWEDIKVKAKEAFDYFLTEIMPSLVEFAGQVRETIFDISKWIREELIPAFKDFWADVQPVIRDVANWITGTLIPAFQDLWAKVQPILKRIVEIHQEAADTLINEIIPAVRDFVDGAIETFQAFADWLDQNVRPVLDSLVDLFVVIGERLKQVWDGAWMVLKPVVTVVLAAILGIVKAITSAISWVWDTFGENIKSVISLAWNFVKSTVEAALKTVKGIIDIITGVISGDWSKVWEGIKSIFAGAWDSMVATVTFVTGLIGEIISAAWSLVQESFGVIWNGISAAFSATWEFMSGIVTGILGFIVGFIQGEIERARAIWDAVWNAISTVASTIWEQIKGVVQGGIEAVVSFVSGLQSRIVGIFTGAFNWLLDAGRKILDGLTQGIKEGWVSAFNWLTGTGSRILNAIGSLGSILYEAGKNVITGLLDGMKAAWDNTAGWLGDRAGDIVNLKGPPKKDAKLLVGNGMLIMNGLQEGMERGWRDVERLLTTLPIQANGSLFADSVLADIAALNRSAAPALPNAGTVGTATNLNVNLYFGDNMPAQDKDELRQMLSDGSVLSELTRAVVAGTGA